MKMKAGFLIREVAGQQYGIAVGEMSKTFHGMIKLNDTAAFIWKQLEQETTVDEIVTALLSAYEVEADAARKSVEGFVAQLRELGILEE